MAQMSYVGMLASFERSGTTPLLDVALVRTRNNTHSRSDGASFFHNL